jgi:hypothetical protein
LVIAQQLYCEEVQNEINVTKNHFLSLQEKMMKKDKKYQKLKFENKNQQSLIHEQKNEIANLKTQLEFYQRLLIPNHIQYFSQNNFVNLSQTQNIPTPPPPPSYKPSLKAEILKPINPMTFVIDELKRKAKIIDE